MNDIKIIGFVGKDSETRQTQKGNSVTKFTVCTDDGFYDKSKSEYVKKDNWHTIIAWNKLSESIAQHVKKGWKVMVSGRYSTRIWEKEDGSKQTIYEIEAWKIEQLVHRSRSVGSFPEELPKSRTTTTENIKSGSVGVIKDDDLPF